MTVDDKNKIVTFEDLARYTEEVLLPAMGTIIDERLEEKLEEKLAPFRQDIMEIKNDIVDIKQELFAIRHELDAINRRLDRLEKTTKEDSDAYDADISELRE